MSQVQPDGFPANSDGSTAPPTSTSSTPSSSSTTISSDKHHLLPQQQQQQGNSTQPALSPQPGQPSELQKQSSVSSIRDALMLGSQQSPRSAANRLTSSNDSSLVPTAQGSQPQRPMQFNSPHLSELRETLSPLTPQRNLSRTPDPSTPRGVSGNVATSPAVPQGVYSEPQDSPSDGDKGLSVSRQSSMSAENSGNRTSSDGLRMTGQGRERKDLNLLDPQSHIRRQNSLQSPGSTGALSPAMDHRMEANSADSSPHSPRRLGKARTPAMSPVDRSHSVGYAASGVFTTHCSCLSLTVTNKPIHHV